MRRVARILGFRRDADQWENPKASIGEPRGALRNGKYNCWEAIGPAREAWKVLGPELKNYVEGLIEYGPALSLGIYMIGVCKDTAAPKVLICSRDLSARKEVRKAIKGSGIMDNYPAIGLGDIAVFPDLLAQEDVATGLASYLTSGNETAVLAASSDAAFGRRLFVPKQGSGTLRRVTAGAIFHVNDVVYQLTVGHAFLESDDAALSIPQASTSDECDFDGQSDTEGNHSFTDHELATNVEQSTPALSQTECDSAREGASRQESSSPVMRIYSSAESETPSGSETPVKEESICRNAPQAKVSKISRKAKRVGKLALLSQTGAKPSLDYAVVELEGMFRNGCNEIALGRNGSQRWLRVGKVMEVGSEDVSIVTMTASSGFLRGKLRATALYMRQPNQRTLQESYSVRLDGNLADGDCGSTVVDYPTGGFYGHIVAGTVGTGYAYIVPAKQVFQDLQERLGELKLGPPQAPRENDPEKHKRKKLFITPPQRPEPLHIIEFASEEFFSQAAKRLIKTEKDERHTEKFGGSSSMQSFVMSQDEELPTPLTIMTGKDNDARRPKVPGPAKSFRSSLSTMRLRALPFLSISHLKGEETDSSHVNEYSTSQARDNQDGGGITSISVFEQRFFALPGDLQEQIIASLSIPDIMNLRATSKDWHNLVSVNETPIIRAFLNQNVIPRFAVSLYSVPHPTAINLHYVCSLRHRLLVSSRLSTMMAEWIANEIFLRRTEAERLEFLPQQARMYYRLVPLLCTIFHFFENFRHLHLEYVLGHNQNLPLGSHALRAIELKIMSTYSNELLLEVHQIFPLFISFLCRKLRPPSYIGRLERSLIGYYKKAPSDHIIAAIFCIGGLREVARFSRIQAYEQRRTAVDLWYDSISTQPISPRNGAGPLSSPLRRVHRRKDPRSENTTLKGKATSERNSVLTQSSASERVDPESLGYKGSSVFDTGLAAGPPMGLLPAESMMRLLPALPALQKIWVSTAESLLLERRVVERKQDIKRNAQVFLSLITEGVTDADVLFYGDAVDDIL